MPLLSPMQRKKLRRHWQRWRRPAWMGNLRRTTPLSDNFGFERGNPVDRYYIERFLEQNRSDIHGHVLEVKNNRYTLRFGAADVQSEVLDIEPANPEATIVTDLAAADSIADNQFDCFVFTQTLQFIYDMQAAVQHIYRILRPGGVLLATLPSITRIDEDGASVDYWRFTQFSCQALFGKTFGSAHTQVQVYGNVLSAIAFLAGMAYEELTRDELERVDPNFPVLLGVRAVKEAV